jgi:hypothetical protein
VHRKCKELVRFMTFFIIFLCWTSSLEPEPSEPELQRVVATASTKILRFFVSPAPWYCKDKVIDKAKSLYNELYEPLMSEKEIFFFKKDFPSKISDTATVLYLMIRTHVGQLQYTGSFPALTCHWLGQVTRGHLGLKHMVTGQYWGDSIDDQTYFYTPPTQCGVGGFFLLGPGFVWTFLGIQVYCTVYI